MGAVPLLVLVYLLGPRYSVSPFRLFYALHLRLSRYLLVRAVTMYSRVKRLKDFRYGFVRYADRTILTILCHYVRSEKSNYRRVVFCFLQDRVSSVGPRYPVSRFIS